MSIWISKIRCDTIVGKVPVTCNQRTDNNVLLNDYLRMLKISLTHEFGAMTPTRSPGSMPALSEAYARFWIRWALGRNSSRRMACDCCSTHYQYAKVYTTGCSTSIWTNATLSGYICAARKMNINGFWILQSTLRHEGWEWANSPRHGNLGDVMGAPWVWTEHLEGEC